MSSYNEAQDVELEEELASENEGAPEAEDKHSRFLRLSEQRIQKAEKYIALLGYLANKTSNEYSPEEVEKMFAYLQEALDDCREKFVEKPAMKTFRWSEQE